MKVSILNISPLNARLISASYYYRCPRHIIIFTVVDPEERGFNCYQNLYNKSKHAKPLSIGSMLANVKLYIKSGPLTNSIQVLISLPTRASSLRASLLEHLLEPASEADKKGGVSAVATVSAIRAALQTVKSTTCLLVSLSADLEIIPIVQGKAFQEILFCYFFRDIQPSSIDRILGLNQNE